MMFQRASRKARNTRDKIDAGQKGEALAILQKHRKDLIRRCDGCICRLDDLAN